MNKVDKITGPAALLMRENIDTDVIIRIERLAGAKREMLGTYAFEALRYRADGSENPAFPFNQPALRHAPILVAGANFGCGSSREGAVWALMGLGVQCVIAESFGDIFFNNCFQNGMLPVVLPQEAVARLALIASDPAVAVTADLPRQVIAAGGEEFPFPIDPLRKETLLEGLDEIGLTLKLAPRIAAWQRADRAARPWIWSFPEGVVHE